MRKFLQIVAFIACLFLSDITKAQIGEGDVFQPIGKYLVKGDADSLSAWFDDNLEVSILAQTNTVSREQGKQILKAFFEKQRPRTFNITHSSERSNTKCALGTLEAGGSSYMVIIFVNYCNQAYKIQQFRIENN